jgi:hypothetical protein
VEPVEVWEKVEGGALELLEGDREDRKEKLGWRSRKTRKEGETEMNWRHCQRLHKLHGKRNGGPPDSIKAREKSVSIRILQEPQPPFILMRNTNRPELPPW